MLVPAAQKIRWQRALQFLPQAPQYHITRWPLRVTTAAVFGSRLGFVVAPPRQSQLLRRHTAVVPSLLLQKPHEFSLGVQPLGSGHHVVKPSRAECIEVRLVLTWHQGVQQHLCAFTLFTLFYSMAEAWDTCSNPHASSQSSSRTLYSYGVDAFRGAPPLDGSFSLNAPRSSRSTACDGDCDGDGRALGVPHHKGQGLGLHTTKNDRKLSFRASSVERSADDKLSPKRRDRLLTSSASAAL